MQLFAKKTPIQYNLDIESRKYIHLQCSSVLLTQCNIVLTPTALKQAPLGLHLG